MGRRKTLLISGSLNTATQFEEFKQELKNALKSVPQSSKIPQLNEKTYGISLRDSADNWSIFYHNNQLQAKAIAGLISDKKDISSIKALLKTICDKGYYATSDAHKLYFNDEVRTHLKRILAYKF